MRLLPIILLLVLMTSALSLATTDPALVPDAAVMKFDEISSYELGYAHRGQPEQLIMRRWTGQFDEKTGVACYPADEQNGKKAFLLHCPWIGGTGVSFQQFTFKLPKVPRINLRGFTAMRTEAIGKSDGATFRVYANDNKLLDINRADANWKSFNLNLTPYAGQTVIIRFETDPGPKDDPSFDYSVWAERELVLVGYHAKPITHPNPPALDLSKMISRQGTVVPASGFDHKTTVKIVADTAIIEYSGPDGMLQYAWKRPTSAEDPFFGKITLKAHMKGDKPVQISLANDAMAEWTGPVKQLDSIWVPKDDTVACVRNMEVAGNPATVTLTARMVGKSLVFDVTCSKPVVQLLDAGGWLPALRRIPVTAPYYSGQVNYLPTENLFVNTFLDWTSSNASSQDGVRAIYSPLTDGTRNLLKERVVYTAAWHFAETLPNIPNTPSPYMRQVGGKVVIDVWGGAFGDIASKLETLYGLGIDQCIVIIHDWQRSGYDNALPMHYPAQTRYGGDEAMKKLTATAKRLGYLIALHENYVDYYPNYDFFDPSDIALNPDGKQMISWYNSYTKIQAFAEKPNSIMKFAHQQSPEINRRYGTDAMFLDVCSAVPPWFHVDSRAGEEGAGLFSRVWDVHQELWAFERMAHGGPVFGEGCDHWRWSGCLDGVEAQFGVGWGNERGLSAPLAVDFDLTRIHPLQVNHGMGYYDRWEKGLGSGHAPPMVRLDQYRMQEIAYGHAGFLMNPTISLPLFAWLEHNLVTPVSTRYATANPATIQYQINGKWVDSTAAAKAGVWNRVEVRYSNGLTITANNSNKPMQTHGITLPRFGWFARGAGVTAYTALKGNKLVDYAETKTSIFANARNILDWDIAGPIQVRPRVKDFAQIGPREFRASYTWSVNSKLAADYNCFVHFDDQTKPDTENIRFQQDHLLAIPTSQWKLGTITQDGPYTITLPEDLADGDYPWSIGLHQPLKDRLLLSGADDGHSRIRLGILKVRDKGNSIQFQPEAEHNQADIYRSNLNKSPAAIDFGPVRTDGSMLLRREGNEWVLRTMTRERNILVEINVKRCKMPAKVICIGDSATSVTPTRSGDWWRLPATGAKEYRWKAE